MLIGLAWSLILTVDWFPLSCGIPQKYPILFVYSPATIHYN